MRLGCKHIRFVPHTLCALLAVVVLACSGGVANAGTVSPVFFEIEVESSLGSATHTVMTESGDVEFDPDGPLGPTWSWFDFGIELEDIATLNYATLTVVGDPQIGMSFALTAGEADTTVTITTAQLSFDPFDTSGRASAGIGLTETGGDPVATMTGAGYNGSAYTAFYNDVAWDASPYLPYLETTGSDSIEDDSGSVAFPEAVSSMQVQYSFVLSAGDQANGSTTYIIPEPASFLLLALGGLVLRRR
jgi:MYXO-CTERM domain-containing protein